MPEILLIAIVLFVLFGLPLITALFAKNMGRRFWVWFGIGCALPVISAFVVFFLPDLNEKNKTRE